MRIKKQIVTATTVFILISLISQTAEAASLQAKTYFGVENSSLMTAINSPSNQIITNIPYSGVLNNTSTITGVKLICGKSWPTRPNGNLIIRLYKNHGGGVYEQLESVSVTPGTFCDYGTQLFINFYYEYSVGTSDFAVGLYDMSTSGNWYLFNLNEGSPAYKHSWLYLYTDTSSNPLDDVNDNIVTESITDATGNPWPGINHIPIEVYGYSNFPTPPPTPPPNIQPCSTGCDTPIPYPTGTENLIGNNYTVPVPATTINYENFTKPSENCPYCLGNETKSTSGHLPSNSSFTQMGIGLGYCNDEGCSTNDLINIAYDFSVGLFFLSLFILGYKVYRVVKK